MRASVLHGLALLILPSLAGAASFTPLGVLPGGTSSVANAVSADGRTVVGNAEITNAGTRAFIWSAENGMVSLTPGESYASGISQDGATVVGHSPNPLGGEAYRWTANSGLIGLGMGPGNPQFSAASAVSADGSVIVGEMSAAGYAGRESMRWTIDTGLVGIGGQVASAVSAEGSVVVGRTGTTLGSEAYRWTMAGGLAGLGVLPGESPGLSYSYANGVSADGNVVVGSARVTGVGTQAFRWTAEDGMVGLGYAPGTPPEGGSEAWGVSADGSVIVGRSGPPGGAFVWTEAGGMQRLLDLLVTRGASGLEGWQLDQGNAISPDGQWVVGRATSPSGQVQAFLANISPIPVPPAIWLFGSALGLMSLARRKLAS